MPIEYCKYRDKTFKASKESIEKAASMYSSHVRECKKSIAKRKTEYNEDSIYTALCSSSRSHLHLFHYKNIFRKQILRDRMIDCIISNEWEIMPHMLMLLLNQRTHFTRIIWRYLIIIMLYYPGRSEKDLSEFMKLMVGCRDEKQVELSLKEILTLKQSNKTSRKINKVNKDSTKDDETIYEENDEYEEDENKQHDINRIFLARKRRRIC